MILYFFFQKISERIMAATLASKANKKSIIATDKLRTISEQQKTLFDGYLRSEVELIDVWDEIPLDLINLVYTFFNLDIVRKLPPSSPSSPSLSNDKGNGGD